MSKRLEELDYRPTPIGDVSLRRRTDPLSGVDIFEVKLGDEFLMSSLFHVAELEVARLALARLTETSSWSLSVAVGGLGLGYTAHAVLADPRVQDLVVVDFLEAVIDWHERGSATRAGPTGTRPRSCQSMTASRKSTTTRS
jgi:hypothetical protein